MTWRVLAYAVGPVSAALTAAALGVAAWALNIPRIDAFALLFIVVIGLVTWRFGRGPAILTTVAAALLTDYLFLPPQLGFGLVSTSDAVRLVIGLLAAAAVIQFVELSRRRQVLEKRNHLLQEVSPRIIQSLDADEITDTVAEATLRVIDYQHFRVYRWDDAAERLILVKSVARAAPYADADWQSVKLALGEGITGIAAKTRRSLLVPDASQDSRMVYPPNTTPIQESILSVPMITQDRLFGALSLARLRARSLSEEDLRLMESIAAQTALALANAEQFAEAEQTIKALAMIEALQPLEDTLPESEVDKRIVEGLVEMSQADLVTLRVLHSDGLFHVAASGGRQWPGSEVPMGDPLAAAQVAWLSDPKVTVYVADPETSDKLPEWARRGIELARIKTSVFLPLRVGRRFLGLVGLHWRRPRWFRSESLGRLQLIAAQAAIALDTRRALEREHSRAESLAELERARREFMQIASHELRTPLTVIRGYASLLEEGSLGQLPPPAQKAVQTLLDKSGEMRIQVERMLLLGRLEDGGAPPQMTPLDLRAVISEAVERVRPQVTLREGQLDLDLDPGPLPVLGDPDRLGTAVDNLLQNAVKFSPGPPSIEVVGNRQDGHIRLTIRDHGIGIPGDALPHLFEKFFRVHDPQLNNVIGTGIGLYLVRQVVEGHGGRVQVKSQPGEGAAFEIDLPIGETGPART
jgi:signal transduction histidine kinase